MADISMCEGRNCKQRNECYRYTAVPDKLQSYVEFDKIKEKDSCNGFLEDEYGKKNSRS